MQKGLFLELAKNWAYHRTTASPDDLTAQQAAIDNAETIFRYVATTYLVIPSEAPRSEQSESQPAGPVRQIVARPSFLANACSFQIPATSVTTATTSSPAEELEAEIDDYFAFRGESGLQSDEERLVRLMDPLQSWKVCLNTG